MVVLILARAVVTPGVCVRDVIVVIQQHILLTNFTVLRMQMFDAIFGMDWIDC